MRFSDIGQQLRAYRQETGLRAEEVAARLGVSRAALYRYEKGEVIKLDTVQRLAELLKISPLSLLGMDIEYYARPAGFFERLRQLEDSAEQVLQVDGGLCYLTTGEAFDAAIAEAFGELSEQAGTDRASHRAAVEQLLGVQAVRKRAYGARRPAISCIVVTSRLAALLEGGFVAGTGLSERTRRLCRRAAEAEVERIAGLMESEPMGLQFGLMVGNEPSASFMLLRGRDRASLAINPFRPDCPPFASTGVATITTADEAISAHQRAAEALWREALKGTAAAAKLRELLARYRET
jgi:transcriptional regulator with XRE-family HTH domain